MKNVLITAALVASLLFLISAWAQYRYRYQDPTGAAEVRAQRERLAEIAEYRNAATTPEQKTLMAFVFDRDFDAEKKKFTVTDGISQYEAWLLATIYCDTYFGTFTHVDLPKKVDRRWQVGYVTHHGLASGMVYVNSQNGVVTCEGKPTIRDAVAFVRNPEQRPNQSVQPTAGTVTSRATESESK